MAELKDSSSSPVPPSAAAKAAGIGCVAILLAVACVLLPMLTLIVGISAWIFPGFVLFLLFGSLGSQERLGSLPQGVTPSRVRWAFLAMLVVSTYVAWVISRADPQPLATAPPISTHSEVTASSPSAEPPTPAAETPTPAAEARPTNNSAGSIQTNVDNLLDEFAENQIAAQRKFGKGAVHIRGVTVRVREALGTGILVLASAKNRSRTVDLYFAESAETQLAEVRANLPTEAVCLATIELAGEVVLSDCRSVIQGR